MINFGYLQYGRIIYYQLLKEWVTIKCHFFLPSLCQGHFCAIGATTEAIDTA